MINESVFEKELVIKKFTDDLGYTLISNNLFNDENMFYQEGLKKFIEDTQSEEVSLIVKKEYSGSYDLFWKDFFISASKEIYYKHNVCIKMNKKISLKINGSNYSFFIYESFDQFSTNRNNYSVISQLPINRRRSVNNINIIPDIGVFVNGILICYMELKFNNTMQSAKDSGRKKIISDYSECIGEHVFPLINNKKLSVGDKNEIMSNKLKVFHSPIFLISLDNHSAYIYRNIRELYNQALSDYKNEGTGLSRETLREGLKNFKIDCIFEKKDEKYISSKEKMDRFFKNTLSKESIQNEICILNTLKFSKDSSGNNTDNTAKLFTPRPNQKFSLDIINEKIKEYYEHEEDIYYFERKERKVLEDKGIPYNKIEEIMDRQRRFKNNKTTFSLLLQYSTGFGKTNIACSSSILLKNMKDKQNEYLFDKILLVSDRVDLKNQVSIEMEGMNIVKSLYGTPKNKEQLHSMMKSENKRIIIVNIQKFKFFKELIDNEDVTLKKIMKGKRVAFIIDEIHRSHSGTMHETMTDMFSDLNEDFLKFSENLNTKKKNIIIALTATPTEENLARFGELSYVHGQPFFKPFDSYTMSEAIKDGFVLNPIKSMLFLSQAYHFEEKKGSRLPTKSEIYKNADRILECSKIIVKTLIETTYNQISKQGKAMLCCSSIESANLYHKYIKIELKKYLKVKSLSAVEIEKILDMVLMVYTHSQVDGQPAYKRCGMKNEKEVIDKFKDGKNGLMIVVDKLQTGFNEPKLHTLFLDKEVSGINCVQTLSRVNRVMKGKKDCIIVDFSYNNENYKNIKSAFEKYEGMVSSSLDPFSIEEKIIEEYLKITKSEYYKFYFLDKQKNIERSLQKSEYIKFNLQNNRSKIEILYDSMSSFRKNIGIVKNIISLEEKYLDEDFLDFVIEFIKIAYIITKECEDEDDFTDIVIDDSGFIINEEFSTLITSQNEKNKNSNKQKSTGESSIDEIISRNKKEENKLINIEKYKSMLYEFFKILDLKDEDKLSGMFQKTLRIEGTISEEDYVKIYNSAKRDFRKKGLENSDFINVIDEVREYVKGDYVSYLRNIN